ncbi:MAG: polyprenyl synthetase family protein [Bacteroidota bacterium]
MPSSTASPISRDQLLAAIAEPIAGALAETERQLEALIPDQMGGMVPVIYRHVLKAGGKRLRPMLALLSCVASGGDPNDCVNLAMAVEVLHLSSLIHDDVIDEASQRRGRPSVRQQWGNRASILVGDLLVAEVFSRMADEPGRAALAVLAQSVARMCQSELLEQDEDPLQLDERLYFDNIRGKTGALMAAACEVGAIVSGNAAARQPLAEFGMDIGQGFQIIDDLLDLYGNSEALGKPVLQDLGRGQWTLPVIRALQTASEAEAQQLRSLLVQAKESPAAAAEAAALTDQLGGREYAREKAQELVARAHGALSQLPESPARESLRELASYAISRQY